ncbi:Ig-like domain-containing protein, partial [Tannerella forsythia]
MAYRAAPVWKEFKVGDTEPPVPGDGGKLTVSVSYMTFKVEWTKASDNESYYYDLNYTLFWRKASESVWKEVDMLNTTAYLWEAEANTEYVVYVRVKDEAGNYADYETKKFKTLPSPPPVPGGGGKLTVSNITGSGFTVNWEKAEDSKTPQNELIYKVYCKRRGHTIPIFQSSDLVATLTDKTSYTITGLGGSGGISINPALDKGYDVNVKVVDADGSSAWYKSENVKLAAPTVAVTGVTLAPNTLTLKVGQTDALTATVAPATATNKAVTWTSSAPAIATVDASGTVRGVSPGTATITVKTVDGGKTATATVTVKEATVPVTGVTVDPGSLTLKVGQTGSLTATVAPATATNKAVTWTSSAPAIATVDASGTVRGVSPGMTTITVRTNDGGKTATATVTVKAGVAPAVTKVTGITLNYSSITVNGDL